MSEPTDAMPSTLAIAGAGSTEQPTRTGSPFAIGSSVPGAKVVRNSPISGGPAEGVGEGVWRETAAAAAFSSVMLMAFAGMSYVWFSFGGIAIAALGISMSLMGLSSRYVAISTATLVFHVIALCGCYLKLI